jgi:hypothetical protein
MFLARWRENDFAGPKYALFLAYLKRALAFKYVVNFVLAIVGVWRLRLARLETIDVTDKTVRAEEHVLFHLVGRKLFGVGDPFEVLHIALPSEEIENLFGYYHRVHCMQIDNESVIR